MKTKSKPAVTNALPKSVPFLSYFSEVKSELVKVTWPTRKHTIRMSILVIVASVAVGAYLGALDYVFVQLISLLINRPF